MAIELGSAYGKVSIDASGVKAGTDSAIGSLKTLSQIGMQVGRDLQMIGAGLSVALTAPIVAFGVASVKSAMESEDALAELDAVLKSTGGSAGMTRDELTRMASALQRLTQFSDEEIISVESMLLTFTAIKKDVFPQATEAVLNLAQKFGSVEQAAVQVGKALADPISGVTALRRVGVMLTDQQEAEIKKFVELGDVELAQKIILKELETEFGGLAEKMGGTTAGKMKILSNAFDDFKEKVGEVFLPILAKAAVALTKLLDAFLGLPPGVQKVIIILGIVAAGFLAIIGPMVLVLGTIVSIISSIAGAVSMLVGAGVSLATIGAAITAVGAAIGGVIAVLATVVLPILIIIATLAALYLAFKYNFGGIRTTVEQLGFIIKYRFSEAWNSASASTQSGMANIGASIQTGTEGMKATLGGWIDWMRAAWQGAMDFLARAAAWGRNAIFSVFRVDWAGLGRSIIQGIINGFSSGLSALVTAATNAANAALSAIKKTLGISSPSMEAFKLGALTAQGYALGLKQTLDPREIAKLMARPIQNLSTSSNQQLVFQYAGGVTRQEMAAAIAINREQTMDDILKYLGA